MKLQETKFLKYVKTDKHGTEIYHDFMCPRCGGHGFIDHFKYVEGGKCFECGGSGFRFKAKKLKIYTEERRAKLDETNAKKEEKRQQEYNARIEKEKAERASEVGPHNATVLKNLGFNEDGIGYIYIGKTYSHLETFKSNGAKFNKEVDFPLWLSPIDLGDLKGTWHCQIIAKEILKTNHIGMYTYALNNVVNDENYNKIATEYGKHIYENQSKNNYFNKYKSR